MLTEYQRELIHREIDGENTAEASAEVSELVAKQPEAQTLMTSLQSLDALIREVPDREPPPAGKQAVYNAVSMNSRASPKDVQMQEPTQTITQWAAQQWNGISNFMEELMLTKKVLLGATTAVAVVAIAGYLVVGHQPSIFDAGTIGDMGGVQQAARYHGAKKTDADVTLTDPQIQTLLQNDKVLTLIRSEVFRDVMHNDALRGVMMSDAFRNLSANQTFRDLMGNNQFRDLMNNAHFRDLMGSSQFRDLMGSSQFHDLMGNSQFHDLMASGQFHDLMGNSQFRDLMGNSQFHDLMGKQPVPRSDGEQPVPRSDGQQPVPRSDGKQPVP